MNKVKVFIVNHKLITVVCFFILIYAIAGGLYLADQHRKQQEFYDEHPLVNKVYKSHVLEKPAEGDWTTTDSYYIFGNNEYRDKVIEIFQDEGGLKRVKEIMNDENEYKKEFDSNTSEKYIVEDGNKLIIGDNPENVYSHQVKDGENWVGMYNPDNKNEEEPGEIHKTTPVNID